MTFRDPLGVTARRLLAFAALAIGATVLLALSGRSHVALCTGTLAAAAVLTVLEKLVNREESR